MQDSAMAEAPILSSTSNPGSGIDNIHLSLPIQARCGELWASGNQLHNILPGGEIVEAYLDACWAEATKRAYATDLRDFLSWGGAIPASSDTLARYIAERAMKLSPATLARRLVGIGTAHTVAGFRDPAKDPLVGMVLRGIRRRHGVTQRRALPVDPRLLPLRFPGTRGSRDRALLLLGFSAALRRSEIVALDLEDLSWSDTGVSIRLRKSKTDQEMASRQVAVPFVGNGTCSATAIKEWIASSGVVDGALFRSIDSRGRTGERLHPQSVNKILKRFAELAGIPAYLVSGHSLRAGFVTAAVMAGADLASIQRQTGHVSLDMLAKYIRGVDPFSKNANFALSGALAGGCAYAPSQRKVT
jgi:site-specific recombinase XerD